MAYMDAQLCFNTMLLDLQNYIATRYKGENGSHIDTGKMISAIAQDGLIEDYHVGVGYKLDEPHGWLSILYMKYGTPYCAPFLSDCEGLVEEWMAQNLEKYMEMLLPTR